MESGKKSKLVQEYLTLMPAITPASAEIMQTATLKSLRPASITQAQLADILGVHRNTIINWEQGKGLDGLHAGFIWRLSRIYNRRAEEILAAIENTRIPEEDTEDIPHSQNAPPPEVVQR